MTLALGKGSDLMVKQLPVMILAGMLSACSSSPSSDEAASRSPKGGCYQSEWQAETVPVINKRLGPDGLEKYDEDHQHKAPGCP
ncbi:hypothetical protein V7V80_09235 [Pseudomonas kermanshahensis]|jgi:hypothetical protein|uniref:Lipoprotein n=1 Tax=Pseudomonas kermanshahensis TaxID=2745482 RepID=A0ABU8R4T6_9PSED|nr:MULTISPECIES: hypothetical protein [Pseudomonas]ATP52411.1 hypothetical protein CR512_24995 [Pseudomonas putida]MBC3484960.1 hypothetical protein [Pseudomonas sp. SWRI50]MBC3494665.1 hypothetical protein [Pseudomonas sp. SWRI67]MBV4529047.1 hypothetical protein [Pseudomonas kermanshahensis]MCX2689232.1 hypothetical protein [Pseudomonas sp. DCB_AW]